MVKSSLGQAKAIRVPRPQDLWRHLLKMLKQKSLNKRADFKVEMVMFFWGACCWPLIQIIEGEPLQMLFRSTSKRLSAANILLCSPWHGHFGEMHQKCCKHQKNCQIEGCHKPVQYMCIHMLCNLVNASFS